MNLQQTFIKHGQSSESLNQLIESFKYKNKGVVFLVNVEKSMNAELTKVQADLELIFDKGLEDKDRISLITYSKNCRRLFSLVEKEKNFVQLRN
jgi:uncharacterized protein YjiK